MVINYLDKRENDYSISIRKKAHGTGAAMAATKEILSIAFEELGLKRVYLNVLAENKRANAFYKKVGFMPYICICPSRSIQIGGSEKEINWYQIKIISENKQLWF